MPTPILGELCLLACAIAVVSGCAGPASNTPVWSDQLHADGWQAGAPVLAIPDFRIDGYKVLDNAHVVIFSGADRRHLLSFGSACPGLLFAEHLGWRATDGSLGRLDRLIVFGQSMHNDCVIDSIQPLQRLGG